MLLFKLATQLFPADSRQGWAFFRPINVARGSHLCWAVGLRARRALESVGGALRADHCVASLNVFYLFKHPTSVGCMVGLV